MNHVLNYISFYKVDDDGNPILNKDGSTKLFTLKDGYNVEYFVESIDVDDLKPIESEE